MAPKSINREDRAYVEVVVLCPVVVEVAKRSIDFFQWSGRSSCPTWTKHHVNLYLTAEVPVQLLGIDASLPQLPARWQ
jgi:hypothetical protein